MGRYGNEAAVEEVVWAGGGEGVWCGGLRGGYVNGGEEVFGVLVEV